MKFDKEFFDNIDYDNLKMFLSLNGMDFTQYDRDYIAGAVHIYLSKSAKNDNYESLLHNEYNYGGEARKHDEQVLNIFEKYFNITLFPRKSTGAYITKYVLKLKKSNDK